MHLRVLDIALTRFDAYAMNALIRDPATCAIVVAFAAFVAVHRGRRVRACIGFVGGALAFRCAYGATAAKAAAATCGMSANVAELTMTAGFFGAALAVVAHEVARRMHPRAYARTA